MSFCLCFKVIYTLFTFDWWLCSDLIVWSCHVSVCVVNWRLCRLTENIYRTYCSDWPLSCLTVSEFAKYLNLSLLAVFQIGKEHVGLKAVTEILQDIQYKVRHSLKKCFLHWPEREQVSKQSMWSQEKGFRCVCSKTTCESHHLVACIRTSAFYSIQIIYNLCSYFLFWWPESLISCTSTSTATSLVDTSSSISQLTWF